VEAAASCKVHLILIKEMVNIPPRNKPWVLATTHPWTTLEM
jgi:hypothetical protein